jgi:hypothetical protein
VRLQRNPGSLAYAVIGQSAGHAAA